LFKEKIATSPKASLKMLHFFINTGIKDTAYYWSELSRFIFKYCELRKICDTLDSIDIGGGFPIKTSLTFSYDYKYMIEQIVENIKWICDKNNVPVPNIFTEFGSYTVGESGAILYSIVDQKLQNDKELWYMIDGSFITQMPDAWGLNQKYILQVFLPMINDEERLYIGFFHTGAYQESLGGYGGIQHCLVPAPKHVLVSRNDDGEITTKLFAPEQHSETMMKVLGYSNGVVPEEVTETPAQRPV
jgi:arginine decarboxylase